MDYEVFLPEKCLLSIQDGNTDRSEMSDANAYMEA